MKTTDIDQIKARVRALTHAIHIAILQPKGGSGKTTFTYHFAIGCAEFIGLRILLIDQDQSCNLTEYFMDRNTAFSVPNVKTLYQIDHRNQEEIDKVKPTRVKEYESGGYIDILPSFHDLSFADKSTDSALFNRLKMWLLKSGNIKNYDLVITDNPGHFATLNMSAMTSANYVLSPVEMTDFGIDGVERIEKYLEDIRDFGNPLLEILGYVPFKSQINTVAYKSICTALKAKGFIDKFIDGLNTQIYHTAAYVETIREKSPIWTIRQNQENNRRNGEIMKQTIFLTMQKLLDAQEQGQS